MISCEIPKMEYKGRGYSKLNHVAGQNNIPGAQTETLNSVCTVKHVLAVPTNQGGHTQAKDGGKSQQCERHQPLHSKADTDYALLRPALQQNLDMGQPVED